MRLLVIHRGQQDGSPEGHQVHGFGMYRRALARELGLTTTLVEAQSLDAVCRAAETQQTDAVMVMVSWAEPVSRVIDCLGDLAALPHRPQIVFLDYYAPSCSPHFGVLPFVDRYIKRQVLRNRDLYQHDFQGGYIFTDYLARRMGLELDGWRFGSRPDPAHLHKLVPGWNLGVTPKYRRLLRWSTFFPLPWRRRPFAINCRIGRQSTNQKQEWYQRYRALSLDKLTALAPRHRLTGVDRVSPKKYLAEMLLSRIVFSPFGWGELCFRDYEAIACGALLVKPSMAHLETHPDIFIDHETYVPVAWDLSDLTEVCRHYLEHPAEAERILHNARTRLSDYFESGGFVESVRTSFDGMLGEGGSRKSKVGGRKRKNV